MTEEIKPTHYFVEGQRVSFTPEKEIKAALEEGYLELRDLVNGRIVHKVIRAGERPGTYAYHYQIAGEPAAFHPAVYTHFGHLSTHHDLHAYEWHANDPCAQRRKEAFAIKDEKTHGNKKV